MSSVRNLIAESHGKGFHEPKPLEICPACPGGREVERGDALIFEYEMDMDIMRRKP